MVRFGRGGAGAGGSNCVAGPVASVRGLWDLLCRVLRAVSSSGVPDMHDSMVQQIHVILYVEIFHCA